LQEPPRKDQSRYSRVYMDVEFELGMRLTKIRIASLSLFRLSVTVLSSSSDFFRYIENNASALSTGLGSFS